MNEKRNHLVAAKYAIDRMSEYPGNMQDVEVWSQVAIAEALTGILELLTGVIGDRGSVVDVRVQGSVSTGDQR